MSALDAPVATDCRVMVRRCPDGHVHLIVATQSVTFDLPLSADEASSLALQIGIAAMEATADMPLTEAGSCH